jgi:hypothetical protein
MSVHKHSDAIHAWAEGFPIQKFVLPCCVNRREEGEWKECKCPMWLDENEYRVKPKDKIWEDD